MLEEPGAETSWIVPRQCYLSLTESTRGAQTLELVVDCAKVRHATLYKAAGEVLAAALKATSLDQLSENVKILYKT